MLSTSTEVSSHWDGRDHLVSPATKLWGVSAGHWGVTSRSLWFHSRRREWDVLAVCAPAPASACYLPVGMRAGPADRPRSGGAALADLPGRHLGPGWTASRPAGAAWPVPAGLRPLEGFSAPASANLVGSVCSWLLPGPRGAEALGRRGEE